MVHRGWGWLKARPARLVLGAPMVLLAGLLALGIVQTVLAAVQLNYFTVIPYPTSVTLEWSTSTEVNLAGFDVQCKLANEPDAAFHEIGYVRAKGGPNVGALYSFPVTQGVVPGVAYCFRLKEITTDGTPGEVFDRCGYGPNVTPTPGVPGVFPTFTPAPVTVPTDAFGNPIIPSPSPQPVATDAFGNPIVPTPIPPPVQPVPGQPVPGQPQAVPTDAFGNPIPTPIPQGNAFASPLPQPGQAQPVQPAPTVAGAPTASPVPGQPTPTVVGAPITTTVTPTTTAVATTTTVPTTTVTTTVTPGAVPTDANGNPIATATPVITTTQTPTATTAADASTAGDAFNSPLPPPGGSNAVADANGADANGVDANGNPASAPGTGAEANANAGQPEYVQAVTPTPAYIVVTATPTPAPVALAPVLTPLPTITPPPAGMQLANSLGPTSQNLMVMLLCLTFTGASGIGILGLITSVMFMRARSSQRDFYDRATARRRTKL